MRTLSRLTTLLLLLLMPAALAQDVRMNQADNASSTLKNNTTQSETNHAASANAVVASWNDTNQLATLGTAFDTFQGWGYSADGVVWTDAGPALVPTEMGWQNFGDPAVDVDSAGNFYMAGLASNTGFLPNAMLIARSTSTSPPIAFGTPVRIDPATAGEDLDKEFIAVDRSGGAFDGRVYLVASEGDFFIPPAVKIVVSHSTSTSPLTMSPLQAISGSTNLNHGVQAAVGPGGEVYVVFGNYVFSFSTITAETIQILKSTDGGASFLNPATLTTTPLTIATPTPGASTVGSGAATVRTRDHPHIAVDTTPAGSGTRGNVYVVFSADPDDAGPDTHDIFFTRSTDGGATWMTPKDISTGNTVTSGRDMTTRPNWQPSITVSPVNGHIYVTFYDKRDSATSVRVYRALSTDGGLTFCVEQLSTASFTPDTTYDDTASNYFGDYNWATANAAGLHFSWGDSRTLCAPPGGAADPCSPSGRPDQDSFYHRLANLSGPDVFIQSWGDVTGIGPRWQTPDIFCVDGMGTHVNAQKGIINALRAHVRNLGDAAANNVTVRFKFAPWFAGIDDSMLKEIAAPMVSLTAAGTAGDAADVAASWDLTDLMDNNSGQWPLTVGDATHFCVKVWLELASDINQCNNLAQNNFFDVTTAMGVGMGPFKFMIGAARQESAGLYHFVINDLPPGYRAQIDVEGISRGELMKGFRLKPGEIRVATVRFVAPEGQRPKKDVVADISLYRDRFAIGGISARIARGTEREPDLSGIRPDKDAVRVARSEPPPQPPSYEPKPVREGYPPRTIPDRVKVRHVFKGNYETVFKTIVSVLAARSEPRGVTNEPQGLINTRAIKVANERLRTLVDDQQLKMVRRGSGQYIVSFYLRPIDRGTTEVGILPLITVDTEAESPLGRRVQSNGKLEAAYIAAIERALQ